MSLSRRPNPWEAAPAAPLPHRCRGSPCGAGPSAQYLGAPSAAVRAEHIGIGPLLPPRRLACSDMPWPVRTNAIESYTNITYEATVDLFTSLRQQGLRVHYWP